MRSLAVCVETDLHLMPMAKPAIVTSIANSTAWPYSVEVTNILVIATCSADVASMCDANAVCTPVIDNSTNSASFTCSCKDGFTGDGTAGNCQGFLI